jgi:hypothetical protein
MYHRRTSLSSTSLYRIDMDRVVITGTGGKLLLIRGAKPSLCQPHSGAFLSPD